MNEVPAELLSIVLGPGGALVVAIIAVIVLWKRCVALEAELRAERDGRLADARAVQSQLLGVWAKVSATVDTLERVTQIDLPGISLPPEQAPK
jgi:hypothetical protein